MAEDKPLKSAYEIAMERLRAKDRQAGVEPDRPLSEEQKQEIARLRQEAKAKLAELEILYRERMEKALLEAPEKAREVEQEYQRERQRVEERLESSIARVRQAATD
jgi:hypothetical protein